MVTMITISMRKHPVAQVGTIAPGSLPQRWSLVQDAEEGKTRAMRPQLDKIWRWKAESAVLYYRRMRLDLRLASNRLGRGTSPWTKALQCGGEFSFVCKKT